MPKKLVSKGTKARKRLKEKELNIRCIPELTQREFADGCGINFKESGLFRIAFFTINPNNPNEGNVHSIIYMEKVDVESLVKGLNENLDSYRDSCKKRKKP